MGDEVCILGIKKLKNNYEVSTQEKSYLFDEDTIIKYMILKDKIFLKSDFEKILQTSQVNMLVNKAIRYLSYGLRSAHEIKTYLKDDSLSDAVIEKLKDLNYVNDEVLAKQYLDFVVRNRKGPLYYQSKLKEKGLGEKIILQALEAYSCGQLKENIELISNKFLSTHENLPPKLIKKQLISKLLRDGFESEDVFNYVNGLEIMDQSMDNLRKDYEKLLSKHQAKISDDFVINQKIIQSLLQKGYDYSAIRKIFE